MDKKREFLQPSVDTDTIAELSQKLIEVNNELKHSEHERKMVLENISHDLRAPLTAIRSAIDYLVLKSDDSSNTISKEELDTYLKLFDMRVKTLEVLVNDLYYLTCIDSGSDGFEFKNIPIAQFLEEYFFSTEIDEKYKDYNLVLDVPEDMKDYVKLDIAKFSRVLDNLFNNARKYSDFGSTISLGVYRSGNEVCVYVKDNGRGISDKAIPYIFDRTYRESDSRTPEKEVSSGLGLSIVKSIVEKHNGKIECKSKLGDGSEFLIYLPILNELDKREINE
ncbi:sensor histidine kinase [Butyrivibrio sp. WCE2006]|uniref:sensor histidine kinase n=1 Tax=Butyrivibrio sp. WCE2006 TaxID=1410611 RepID=UPI0005D288C2|nr:HAMP domain-containing sensor histidine kinase [Butyrivibrio sp. WCE2006]